MYLQFIACTCKLKKNIHNYQIFTDFVIILIEMIYIYIFLMDITKPKV